MFSGHAPEYSQFRPVYPPQLVKAISRLVKYRGVVWDVGCGSGQMSVPLAEHFQLVCASDISEKQVAEAPGHKGILYTVQPAEQTDFPDEFFDMVVAAQSIHWFNHEAFYREVNRVLGDGGVMVAVAYGLISINPALDVVINKLYHDVVGPYWQPERKFIESGFSTMPFPFDTIAFPDSSMKFSWNFKQLLGYLDTWSAVKLYEQEKGENPLETIKEQLQMSWGNNNVQEVFFPLMIKAGRKVL